MLTLFDHGICIDGDVWFISAVAVENYIYMHASCCLVEM
jgi:hypothetical protein